MVDMYGIALRWLFVVFTVLVTGVGLAFLALLFFNVLHLLVGKLLNIAMLVEVVVEARRQGRKLWAWDRAEKKVRNG